MKPQQTHVSGKPGSHLADPPGRAVTGCAQATDNCRTLSGVNMIAMNVFSKTSGFRMTRHALERAQQRGIPPLIIHWLCQYGSRRRKRDGCIVCYFDRKSLRLLSSDVGRCITRRLSGLLNAYLVITGEHILTVGHRYKHSRNL